VLRLFANDLVVVGLLLGKITAPVRIIDFAHIPLLDRGLGRAEVTSLGELICDLAGKQLELGATDLLDDDLADLEYWSTVWPGKLHLPLCMMRSARAVSSSCGMRRLTLTAFGKADGSNLPTLIELEVVAARNNSALII